MTRDLYIVPCGDKKIYDKHPWLNPDTPVPAMYVYQGRYTRFIIKYVRRMGLDYLIFSGCYGLIPGDKPLKNYNSGGKVHVSRDKLLHQLQPDKWDRVISLCHRYFNEILLDLCGDKLEIYWDNGEGVNKRKGDIIDKLKKGEPL